MSSNFSKSSDFLLLAINYTQLALDHAQRETSARHYLALKESRATGLIDAAKYESKICQALVTLKTIRQSPGLAALVGAESKEGDAALADDSVYAPTPFDTAPYATQLLGADQSSPPRTAA